MSVDEFLGMYSLDSKSLTSYFRYNMLIVCNSQNYHHRDL